jgi:transposase-like protein
VIGAEKPAALKHGRRLQERSVEGQARQSHRVRVADAYLTGESTVVELADIHQVSVYTIRDWIRDRRDTFMLDHRKRPLGTRRDRTHEPSLVVGVYGTGGTMTDESVRRATRDLEKAIVAGLKKRGLAPLPYRREEATA